MSIRFINRGSLMACGAVLAAAMMLARVSAYTTGSETVTLKERAALPGVTLVPGTYRFEVTNPDATGDVISVTNRLTNQVCFVGFTKAITRPTGWPQNRSILLGERPKGGITPILAWFPRGDRPGHAFFYR
jgi:hypothetical protein